MFASAGYASGTSDAFGHAVTEAALVTTRATLIVLVVSHQEPTGGVDAPFDTFANTYVPGTARLNGGVAERVWYCLAPTVGAGHFFHVHSTSPGSPAAPAIAAWAWESDVAVAFVAAVGSASVTGTTGSPGAGLATGPDRLAIAAIAATPTAGSVCAISSLTQDFTLGPTVAYNATSGVRATALAARVHTADVVLNPTWTISVSGPMTLDLLVFRDTGAEASRFRIPVTFSEFTDLDGDRHAHARVDLNDPASYFSGYKAPLVQSFEPITHALSDRRGNPVHPAWAITYRDTARTFRAMEDHTTKQYLLSRPLQVRTIDDEDRRTRLVLPRVLANGGITQARPLSNYRYRLDASDFMAARRPRGADAQTGWQSEIDVATFGASCPQASLGLKMPIIYGAIDPPPATPPAAAAYPRGGAVPGGWSVDHYAGYSGGSIPNPTTLFVFITLIRAGVEYDYSIPLSAVITTTAFRYYFGIYDFVAGDLYRFYFSTDPAFYPFDPSTFAGARFLDLTPGVDTTDEPGEGPNGQGYALMSLSVGTLLTSVAGAGTNRGGALSVIPVGTETIAGEIWSAFLVGGHACKDEPRLYLGLVLIGSGDSRWGTELLAYGRTGWSTHFGATRYRIRGARRVTMVYAKGATALAALNGTAAISVDVDGTETVGDGTGTLITRAIDQYEHFAEHYMAPETIPPDANWSTTAAVFPAAADVTMIDHASFAAVKAEQNVALPSSDWEGAIVLGAAGEAVAMDTAIARFNLANACDSEWAPRGAFRVSMEPSAAAVDPTTVSDVTDIPRGSFSSERSVQELYTVFRYAHTPDYSGRGVVVGPATDGTSERRSNWAVSTDFGADAIRDSGAIDKVGERPSPVFEFHGLRNTSAAGAATLVRVLVLMPARFARLRRLVLLQVPYEIGVPLENGHIIAVDAHEGPAAGGWQGRQLRLVGRSVNESACVVDLTCYEMPT